MRLFIAVRFSGELEKELRDIVGGLREGSERGNFTRGENLHLTLVFLGELPPSKIADVRAAMEAVGQSPFKLMLAGLGRFRRKGGDLYWLGVRRSPELSAVYGTLYEKLMEKGFQIEDREYSPHLTLGREVALKKEFDREAFEKTLEELEAEVDGISLMKSERVGGRLTYTELFRKRL